MTEEQLIEGCKKGKRPAQEELYNTFSSKMMGVCLRYAGERETARDLLQEGFIKVFTKIEDYSGSGSFEGWMRKIFVNRALEYLRMHADMCSCEICSSHSPSWSNNENQKDTEVRHLHQDAIQLLHLLIEKKIDCCKAIYGIFPANSEGDNIRINDLVFPMLRQQEQRENNVYKSLADYILPLSTGRTDYLGAFVVTAGSGLEDLKKEFENKNDTYSAVLLQTLTDRLAEAAAEYLHEKVRKEYWGYVADENLSIDDLFRVKYKGIRPAIGYPSIPDQLLNNTLDKLLDMSQIGVTLTENGAMVGPIGKDQLKDYAERRHLTEEDVRKLLNKNIN